MFRYIPITEKLYMPEVGVYTSFGILALKRSNSGWKCCKIVSDVSTDYRSVFILTRCCNNGHLNVIHLSDVIEDFLST